MEQQLNNWKTENKLSKVVANGLLEVWRRSHQMSNGSFHSAKIPLTPSEAKPMIKKKMLFPVGGRETPNVTNWYRVEDEAIVIAVQLDDILPINDSSFHGIFAGEISF